MSEELKERIHDLLKINVEHQNLNAELRKEVKYLQEEHSSMKNNAIS